MNLRLHRNLSSESGTRVVPYYSFYVEQCGRPHTLPVLLPDRVLVEQ